MANADTPFGFRPVGGLDSSPYNGATIECVILAADSTATFIGDAVKLSGTASADATAPAVVQAAAGDEIFGVVVSFDASPETSLDDQYRKASTLRRCKVVPALDNLFVIQADDGFAATNVGDTADIIINTAGSTVTGLSGMELDSGTWGTGAGLQVLGLSREPNNEVGTHANVIVRINESALRGDGTAV